MLKKREKHTVKEGKDGWRISTEKRHPFEKYQIETLELKSTMLK